jgi:hypothetical protein
MANYRGGCLCGHIRYSSSATPIRPHFCSCRMCQQWSGAPVVAWVDFPRESLTFDGLGGEPAFFRSSAMARRGFCPKCGGTICAVEDGSDKICVTIATLDDPDVIVPEARSFPNSAPSWLRVEAIAGAAVAKS